MNVVGEVMEDLMGDRFKSRYKSDTSYRKVHIVKKISQQILTEPLLPDNEGKSISK